MFEASQKKKRYPGFDGRMTAAAAVLIAAFLVVALKLWYLQAVLGEYYAQEAEQLRLHFQWLRAPRGMIVAGDSETVLADTQPARDLVVVPALCEGREEEVAAHLERLIGASGEGLMSAITAARKEREPYRHVVVKQNISMTDLTRVEEFSVALPGVFPLERPQRRYYFGRMAGQILGYIGEINRDELDRQPPESDYKQGDMVGRMGLELFYESLLRGRDGQLWVSRYAAGAPQLRYDDEAKDYIVEDAQGRLLREEKERRIEPAHGEELYITLDIPLQQKAEQLLEQELIEGRAGAIVVLDADTGAILAMASTPRSDPSVFVSGRAQERREALEGDQKPMLCRPYRKAYPPGSVFKVLMAMAALEEGVINENTTFFCNGQFFLPGVIRPWKCWRLKLGGHGGVNVVDGLAYSCDVFFYNVGHKLDVDRIKKWCCLFGLGEFTGIDLPLEEPGLAPSREWKEAVGRRALPDDPSEWRWYPGETISLSIGQGSLVTTPLQNAVLMAAVINGGRRVRPYLNQAQQPQVSEPLVSERTLALIQAGLRKCVEKEDAPSGTGWRAKVPGLDILGKTGTAQVVDMKHYKHYENEEDIPMHLRDHALFVAGVANREPRIAVSVVVEHGLHGSTSAAPVARSLFETYYGTAPTPVRVAREEVE